MEACIERIANQLDHIVRLLERVVKDLSVDDKKID